MGKYSGAGQTTDDNMALAHWHPTKQRLQKHTHTRVIVRTPTVNVRTGLKDMFVRTMSC